jgi:hypothetical protein
MVQIAMIVCVRRCRIANPMHLVRRAEESWFKLQGWRRVLNGFRSYHLGPSCSQLYCVQKDGRLEDTWDMEFPNIRACPLTQTDTNNSHRHTSHQFVIETLTKPPPTKTKLLPVVPPFPTHSSAPPSAYVSSTSGISPSTPSKSPGSV